MEEIENKDSVKTPEIGDISKIEELMKKANSEIEKITIESNKVVEKITNKLVEINKELDQKVNSLINKKQDNTTNKGGDPLEF